MIIINRKIVFQVLSVVLLISFINSCKNDDGAYEGLNKNIQDIVPEEILNSMIEMGMPVNRGNAPPILEGSYIASPFVLKKSNIENDNTGRQFSDFLFKLYNQNNSNQSIHFDYINGPEKGTGYGGFVAGSDNSFTVFLSVESTVNGNVAQVLFVLSGEMGSEGITNFYYANFMVDNGGNPGGYFIGDGKGRIIYDSDGLSPTTTLIKSSVKSLNEKGVLAH